MGVGICIQLGRDFINFRKSFLSECSEEKILLNNSLAIILFV
jgi:hypothetical protein